MTAVGMPASTRPEVTTSSANRWLAGLGVIFAVTLAASVLMLSGEPDPSDPSKVQSWVVKNTTLMSLNCVITLVAVMIGMVFLVWLHSHLARNGGWLGTLFVVGAAIFALSGTVAAGVSATFGQEATHLSTDSIQLLATLQENINYPMTTAGLALMFLAAGFLIRRTQLLPGWLAWVSWVFALLAATFVLGFIALIGSALWIIAVSVYLVARPPAES